MLKELLGSLVVLQAADGFVTYVGLTAHEATEKNPLAAGLLETNPGLGIVLIKVVGTCLLLWLFTRPAVIRNPKTPMVLAAIVLGYIWVVLHNGCVVWM